MFKEKSSKKRLPASQSVKDIATLDARHQQKLSEISKHHDTLMDLREQRINLNDAISECQIRIQMLKESGDIDSREYNDQWTSNINMQDQMVAINRQIRDLETAKDEIEYYENTGRILFKYYDVIENQDTNSLSTHTKMPTVQPVKCSRKRAAVPAMRSILDAFAGIPVPASVAESPLPQPPLATAIPEMVVDKSTLVDEYIAKVDPTYLQHSEEDGLGQCPLCHPPSALICIQHEGIMICAGCGYQDVLLVEQNRPLLRQVTKESTASYKRINHFREWCSQMQGKESTDIPESVFEQILLELKKEKIVDKKKITYSKMREILKRLRVNKYYEHVVYIINRINGAPSPHFPPELEEKLCNMFKEIQAPFLNAVTHAAKERKNFLSYAYCIHQFFKILNMPEYLKYTTLLKSREKLYVQDQIFKHICEELGWPFYPTL
jgi:hypothetical protein